MGPENELTENSQAVITHLSMIQAVIQRMATNSSSCKTWCITLVSAILVVIADKGKPHYAIIAVVPALLFFLLDAYYLMFEKMFRKSYDTFVEKLHGAEITACDLYVVMPSGSMFDTFRAAMRSFSVWPFYLTLLAMILAAERLVL